MIYQEKYKYPPNSSVLAPIIEIRISDSLGKKQRIGSALLDTGYDGFLLIPYHYYEYLNLQSYAIDEELSFYGESVSGDLIELLSSFGKIMIGSNFEMEGVIDTFKENTELLLGRSAIESLRVDLFNQIVSISKI